MAPRPLLKPILIPKKIQKNLPRTAVMVDDGLEQLYTVKGVTLQRLRSFIENKYEIKISNQRNTIIKKHLKQLREDKRLNNVTGRGLSGRFRLVEKPKTLIADA